jgi:replicative DNA helicase
MKYFPAMSISTLDIMGVVDDVIDKYGKDAIAGLYIDYLDLLKTDMKYDMYRLELGHITLSLKTLAVQYNIPVITASQLGRRVYSIQASSELNLDQMSESIKKVEHADFVALLAKDSTDKKIVHGKIGKNRAGESNINIDFQVDFSMFKFINASICANKEKDDGTCTTTPSGLKFQGLGVDF